MIVRYEEVPEDADSDDEFQNKITLAKKYDSNAEPKLLIWSVEQLIERFCEQNAYLKGQAGELSMLDPEGRTLGRGRVISQAFPDDGGSKTYELKIVRGSGNSGLRGDSINDDALIANFNPQEIGHPQAPAKPQVKSKSLTGTSTEQRVVQQLIGIAQVAEENKNNQAE